MCIAVWDRCNGRSNEKQSKMLHEIILLKEGNFNVIYLEILSRRIKNYVQAIELFNVFTGSCFSVAAL